MKRIQIKYLLLFIAVLTSLQIVSAREPSKKSKLVHNTEDYIIDDSNDYIDFAEVSACRVLNTLVALINQAKIKESWFDWNRYHYMSTIIHNVSDTSYKTNSLPKDEFHTSANDMANMFKGKKVSHNIKIIVKPTNVCDGSYLIKSGGVTFVFLTPPLIYSDGIKSIFNFTKRKFISGNTERRKAPVISIVYKKSGEIEVLPVYSIDCYL